MTRITVLGSTGSIGCSTLDVVKQANIEAPGRFEVDCLVAGKNVELCREQAEAVRPRVVVFADETVRQVAIDAFSDFDTKLEFGLNAVLEAARTPVDRVVSAISGTAGFLPTLAAVDSGQTVLIANKESIVCAGRFLLERAKHTGAEILPVDSEHNALFQVMAADRQFEKLVITASGGPFRNWSLDEMAKAEPASALAHPNWDMGAKNSLDSATLMNKGLEYIEAAYLFDVRPDQVEVLVHPQSIVHAMATYKDGSVIAHLSDPDMRTPIAHALAWPQRVRSGVQPLDLASVGKLEFNAPDPIRFPALNLAKQALNAGALGTCVFNAANEAAGNVFLAGQTGFLSIAEYVDRALDRALGEAHNDMPTDIKSAEDVLHVTSKVTDWVKQMPTLHD